MKMCICCGNTDPQKIKEMVSQDGLVTMDVCVRNLECYIKPGISTIEDIDELMVDIIQLLIRNKYRTLHCCQGHYYGSSGLFRGPGGYISFEIDQKDKEDFKKYQWLIDSIPDSIKNFDMMYEIVSGPKGPKPGEWDKYIEKLVIRFKMKKDIELLCQLDFIKQNTDLHIRLFGIILDALEKEETK